MTNSSFGRNNILTKLRAQKRNEPHPGAWQSTRDFADLAARFEASLTKVKGEVYRAASLAEAWDTVEFLLQSVEAERIVMNAEEPLVSAELPQRWPQAEIRIVNSSGAEDFRTFAERADVGLSSGIAALAETGSIVVESGAGKSRLVTLLPPIHMAIVPESKLTPDILTWQAQREGQLPASTVVISGPSKSADIGNTLAVGVHGPKRFIVVLYKDGTP